MPEDSQTAAEPPADSPAPEQEPPVALRLDPSLFYLEWIEITDDIDAPEIDGLVELEIENAAPFPIEQLAWGWIAHPGNQRVLCFAAPREMLRKHGLSDWEQDAPIVPDFAAAALLTPETPFARVQTGGEALVLHYDSAGQPLQVEAVDSDDALAPLFDLDSEPTGDEVSHLIVDGAAVSEDEPSTWTVRSSAAPDAPETLALPAERIWYADLREREFKAARQKRIRTASTLWRVLKYAAIFLMVLLGLEVVQWSLAQYIQFRERTLEAQAPVVSRLEQQRSFLFKLEDIQQSRMEPFTVLAVLNEGRPASIQFLRVEATDSKTFEISARGKTVREVNDYAELFTNNPAFSAFTHNIRSSRTGAVDFEIEIIIDTLPEVGPLSPASGESTTQANDAPEEMGS